VKLLTLYAVGLFFDCIITLAIWNIRCIVWDNSRPIL